MSHSFNPWHNLALEESLLNHVTNDQMVLYLWQNHRTVVVGCNQNAWTECRWRELESSGGKLARRLSGGGAVFHDLGNINYSFITNRNLYDLNKQLNVIFQALNELDIKANFSGRNDLTVDGRKFSGNAFYFAGNSALHHGTILVCSDLDNIQYFLQVPDSKMTSKGIVSLTSRVVNLSELNPSVTIKTVIQQLQRSFMELYGQPANKLDFEDLDYDTKRLYQKHASWQWRYGYSPTFDFSLQNRFTWGEIEIALILDKGHIAEATIYSDAIDSEIIQNMAKALKGAPYKVEAISKALDDMPKTSTQKRITSDLKQWLGTQRYQ